nr:homeobox protein luminidependens isoform X2 [Tanacetum cinerariifolium]
VDATSLAMGHADGPSPLEDSNLNWRALAEISAARDTPNEPTTVAFFFLDGTYETGLNIRKMDLASLLMYLLGPQPYSIRSGDMIEVYIGGDGGLKVDKCGIHSAYRQDTKATVVGVVRSARLYDVIMIIIRERSLESRGSGGSAPGSRVQGAAALGRVQGAAALGRVQGALCPVPMNSTGQVPMDYTGLVPLNSMSPVPFELCVHSSFELLRAMFVMAKTLLSRWIKMFARSQAMRKPNANIFAVDAHNEMLLKQSIGEIMETESLERLNNPTSSRLLIHSLIGLLFSPHLDVTVFVL